MAVDGLQPDAGTASDASLHRRTSSFTSVKSTASSNAGGPLSPALSDRSAASSSGNGLSRRASLTASHRSQLNASGRTAAPAYFYLPPGSPCPDQVTNPGEADGSTAVDPSHAVTLARFDPAGGLCVASTTPSAGASQPGSRRLSSSSSRSASASATPSSSAIEPGSSPPSSVGAGSAGLGKTHAAAVATRLSDGLRKPSLAKERAPGEDPELAAARRALWEDEPSHVGDDGARPSVFEEDEEEPLRTPVVEGRHARTESGLRYFKSPVSSEADSSQDDVQNDHYYSQDDDDDDDDDRPPPATPSHATLPPLPSCLRPLAPSRRHSQHSSSSGAVSVRISEDPPAAFPTYSPVDYERKGDEPVSRLSVREWLELQGVREAVGVWSGRIEKLDEATLAALEAGAPNGPAANGTLHDGDAAPNGTTADLSSSVSSLTSVKSDESHLSATKSDSDKRTCGGLAAMVGVVTVGHNSVPVTAPKSLFD